jgi:hypothetical protein
MKKALFVILYLFLFTTSGKIFAQCSFNSAQSGLDVSIEYSETLSPFFTIDSVQVDFGDGQQITEVNSPPASSFNFTQPHSYTSAGSYIVCIAEYTSWGGSPQQPCTHCDTITLGSTSGIFKPAQQQLNIYPNPATSAIHVDFASTSGDFFLQLRDISGRKLLGRNVSSGSGNKFCLDLNELNPGVYYLELQSEQGKYFSRLVKE